MKNESSNNDIADSRSDEEESDSDSDDNDEHLQFKCANLLLGQDHKKHREASYQSAVQLSAATHTSLSGIKLASCHQDGTCKLWDLASRRCIVDNIADAGRVGPGLAVRRIERTQQFLYQSRDVLGTVSLHDIHRPLDPILQLHTHSTTFCQMAPCHVIDSTQNVAAHDDIAVEARNLVALPTHEQSVAILRDLRCDPFSNPSFRIDIGNESDDSSSYHSCRNYGMLTSLALCPHARSQQLVLGCGLEDGSALFYDLRSKGSPWSNDQSSQTDRLLPDETSKFLCHTKLGKDPVLSIDISNPFRKGTGAPSLMAVAGCAGDADELSELPESDQGTISTIKVHLATDLINNNDDGLSVNTTNKMKASILARKRTCSINSGGKVGVSVCRFRPDGRIFAVGSWDRRIRLYEQASSKHLAILHGHDTTVTTIDWEECASSSGLLATGAGDRICVYRVFPKTSFEK